MKGTTNQVDGIQVYCVTPTQHDSRAGILLIHEWWGLNDGWITIGMVNKFEQTCRKSKVPHEIHIYDADYAFMNPTHKNYNPNLAKDALLKTTDFLKRVLE